MTSPPGTSRWGRRTAERWLATWAREPVLVAESLRHLGDPLEPLLALDSRPAPAAVIAAIGEALRPALAPDPPPAWLRPDQAMSFRRALAAVRRYGGVLLAEPPGVGKSWIALAVSRVLDDRRVVVLAPAAVASHWRAVARQAGVSAEVHSHEAVSRGRLPVTPSRCVIIDESHRFRHPTTRRYRTLAPWLAGRAGVLVSATPVVNHARDLVHQLRLLVRTDALAASGLGSLRSLEASLEGREALGEVIVAGHAARAARPALTTTWERPRLPRGLGVVLRDLDRLALSASPGIAALVRGCLWGAAASSPAALAAALLRYLALLDHAADALRAGRQLPREALRSFLAADPAQLVLWELLPGEASGGDLVLADRAAVRNLRAVVSRLARRPDPKVAALQARVASGRRTLVFTGAVATVGYLRRQLEPEPVAWCTGTRAGIGTATLPRDAVLGWFGPGGGEETGPGVRTPRILVATDVAAEGIDLHGASQVVHYDLPWTALRADQRAGRITRIGSDHARVAEHWLLPSRRIASRLGIEQAVNRKRGLAARLGTGEQPDAPWRARQEAIPLLEGAGPVAGIAAVVCRERPEEDAVACVRITCGDGWGATRLLVHRAATGWREDDGRALHLLARAAQGIPADPPAPAVLHPLVESLAPAVRQALREATSRQWEPGRLSPALAVLLRRLRHWGRIAARAHDAGLLDRLDRAVRGLGRGLTAGEEIRLARLAQCPDASLHDHLALLPVPPAGVTLPDVRLVGIVVVAPGD